MFTDPLILFPDKVTSAPAFTFVKTNCANGASIYKASHDANYLRGVYPSTLKLANSIVGKGSGRRNRYQVRMETDSYDESSGIGVYGTKAPTVLYCVWDGPQSFLATDMEQDDVLSFSLRTMVGMMRGSSTHTADTVDYAAVTTKLVAGEV